MKIQKNISGKNLKILFENLNNISNKISVERYCDEKIPNDEFEKVQEKYINFIYKEDILRRKIYKENKNLKKGLEEKGINTDEEANQYFEDLLDQDLEAVTSIYNNGEDRQVKEIEKDVIEKIYTRITTTTHGPLFQQYFLNKGEVLKEIEEKMKSLFDFPYIINGEEYENLAFYIDEKPIFYICSHEKFAISLDKEINKIIELWKS